MINKREAIPKLNELGTRQEPFSFYCDFLGQNWNIQTENVNQSFFLKISNPTTFEGKWKENTTQDLIKQPIEFEDYKKSFDYVIDQLKIGNSFLTNLTFKTLIKSHLTLEEIFTKAQAKYKLLAPEDFVVFSPETFVKIEKNRIYSFPMKGTIASSIPNAEHIILNDSKETAEHITIVDLIRNDLSQVANEVTVPKFRFIDEIKTAGKNLLQVSSQVEGTLDPDWKKNLGDILTRLIPAGSISGAPKPETIRIIREAENYDRGFYTGICGHFDGEKLDSGVMIRFIKEENGKLFYCSGGGITASSEPKKEYQELIDKIYMPINE